MTVVSSSSGISDEYRVSGANPQTKITIPTCMWWESAGRLYIFPLIHQNAGSSNKKEKKTNASAAVIYYYYSVRKPILILMSD